MLESLKSLWARWRVQISFVGGALVVATAYGTCSYDPQVVSEEPAAEEAPAVEEVSSDVSTTGTTDEATTETDATNSDQDNTTTGE